MYIRRRVSDEDYKSESVKIHLSRREKDRRVYNLKNEYLTIELNSDDIVKLTEVMRHEGYSNKENISRIN